MIGNERDGLDEVSFELGKNTQGLQSLNDAFKQHEIDDDRRHAENVEVLTGIDKKLDTLMTRLAPIFANHALTKRRLALVASIGFGILVLMSWALDACVKWAVGWVLKAKFGGP